jgi:hypothetical protein
MNLIPFFSKVINNVKYRQISYTVYSITFVGGSSMTIYHFVGIKGSGMSALAQVLHDMKFLILKNIFLLRMHWNNQGLQSFPFKRKISSQE